MAISSQISSVCIMKLESPKVKDLNRDNRRIWASFQNLVDNGAISKDFAEYIRSDISINFDLRRAVIHAEEGEFALAANRYYNVAEKLARQRMSFIVGGSPAHYAPFMDLQQRELEDIFQKISALKLKGVAA